MASRFLTALDDLAARHQQLNQLLIDLEARRSAPAEGQLRTDAAERLAAENKQLGELLSRLEAVLTQLEQRGDNPAGDGLRFVT